MKSKWILLLSISLFLSLSAAAQFKITGKVIDSRTGEELIGVNVVLEGTKIGASTDLDGNFSIENVPFNTTAVVASYIGYETQRVAISRIGNVAKNTIKLKEETLLLDGATVTVEKITNTESAIVLETKQAKQVISGISRQQMAKSQDKDAAQAMARIPGVTIVENRFVMIRGVSERYNSIMINNVMAPSTEVDKRTFSFDLISSSVLDRMMIFKSGAPELPGDFAGGVIKIYTSSAVSENFTDINFSVGFRQNTTFSPYFQSQGSPTDRLGFDSGFRSLPDAFPSTRVFQSTNRADVLRETAGKALTNNFVAEEGLATPDYSIGATFGRKFDVNGKKLTMLTSVSLSESYQTFQRDFFRYLEWEDRTREVEQRFAFMDANYQRDNKVGVLSNWTYEVNSRNRYSFSNFFSQIGENETILRSGKDFIQRPTEELRNYLLGYTSRTIYSGQFQGDHTLSDKNELRWVIGGSYLGENEPDLRRFRTFKDDNAGEDVGFTMQLPPSSNLFETGRYFGNLNEFSVNHGLDFTRVVKEGLTSNFEIKAGYYTDFRQRQFDSRYFSYLYPGFFDPNFGDSLSRLPLDLVFDPNNIKSRDGFVIEEGTRPIDSYRASNFLNAVYFGTNIPLGLWNVAGGIRYEYNIQVMESRDDASIISVRNPVGSILPFANGSYNINEKNLIRFGYGRTVNRPEFRELAPFLFYDYQLEAGRIGNPNLQTAVIDNIDFRYEFYPRFGETISLGAFFKYFDNPIENRTIITTEQPNFTFINADFAYNYGVELEVKKSFRGLWVGSIFDKLGINANASYIFSEVDLGETAVAQQRTRPLQGQSPYIINAGLFFTDEDKKLDATLNYNIFGPRIFSVGDVLFPTIFELERHSLDFTLSKELKNGIALKVGVQDILNYPFRFFQDTDRTESPTDADDPIFTFRRGSLVTFSMRIKI